MDDKNEQLQQEAARLSEKVKDEKPETEAESQSFVSRLLHGVGSWLVYVMIALVVVFIVKPAIYEHMDASAAAEMTDEQKKEAMGLPLKVSKPREGAASLEREELRWIVMTEIKLDAMRPHINQYNGKAVDDFNAMVDEFNVRCKEYHYKRSDMQTVRNDMAKYREQIQQKAREEVQAKGWDKAPDKSKK
ncbi:hypothetical protein SAMN02910356_00935 [Selenomonas sp. GACV-9]|uniref:hypothetical protein n=1 Tax=Selenomonas sp. GACV-9 TaxID=3158782 RepID=UPI0008F3E31F|nr:hypothetical protein SAMN02910356_00935 [Selenomonas ruminantium]